MCKGYADMDLVLYIYQIYPGRLGIPDSFVPHSPCCQIDLLVGFQKDFAVETLNNIQRLKVFNWLLKEEFNIYISILLPDALKRYKIQNISFSIFLEGYSKYSFVKYFLGIFEISRTLKNLELFFLLGMFLLLKKIILKQNLAKKFSSSSQSFEFREVELNLIKPVFIFSLV